jgi:hypothetical protein
LLADHALRQQHIVTSDIWSGQRKAQRAVARRNPVLRQFEILHRVVVSYVSAF